MHCPEYVMIMNIQLFKTSFYGVEFGFHCATSRTYVHLEAVFKMLFNSI